MRGTASSDVFCVKIGARVSVVALLKNPPRKKWPSHFVPRGTKSRMRRTETPKPISIKFCMVVDIADAVTYTNFGDHRLRVFLGRGVKFPLSHRLSSSPLQHSRTTMRACDVMEDPLKVFQFPSKFPLNLHHKRGKLGFGVPKIHLITVLGVKNGCNRFLDKKYKIDALLENNGHLTF